MADGPVTIGRWEGATIPLEEVERPVEVVLDPEGPGRWRFLSLAPGGCELNGRRVRRGFVGAGDRLKVGAYEIDLSERSAAVSSSSGAALPSSPIYAFQGGRELGLRATLRWQGAILDTRVLRPGETLTVGRGRRVMFALPLGAVAGAEAWAAAACLDGAWHVALDSPLRAVTPDGHPLLSAAVREDGPKPGRTFAALKAWAPLPERVRLETGALSIELERLELAKLPPTTRPPWWVERDGYRSIIAAMVAVCAIAILRLPWEPPFDPGMDLVGMQERMAQFRPPPKPPEPPKFEQLTRAEGEEKEGGAERSRDEEGVAGRRDVPERNARRGGPASDREVVQQHALLQALESGTAAELLSGGALGAASSLGHLDGPRVGDAAGTLGLGLRGNARGGGGASAESVGVGPIGARGNGDGRGAGVGKLKGGGQSELGLDAPARVDGGLDREVIRRVILSHRAQIRYCYEKELASRADLEGRVLVEFVIAADGRVTSARAAEDTLATPAVGQCLVSKVRTWTFPQPKGGGVVVVSYPFMFKPAGGH